ncbi:MAG: hypothetical protein AMXMBFR7_45140 [Planctomycetota bacterium]
MSGQPALVLIPLGLWIAAVIMRFSGQFNLFKRSGWPRERIEAHDADCRARTRGATWAATVCLAAAAALGGIVLLDPSLPAGQRDDTALAAFVAALLAAAAGSLACLDQFRLGVAAYPADCRPLLRRILWGELCFYALFPAAAGVML